MKFFWRALGVTIFAFILVLALIIANAKSNLYINRYTNEELIYHIDSLSTALGNKVDSLEFKINSMEITNNNLFKEIGHSRREHQTLEERIKKVESICRKIDSDMDVFD